MHDAPACATGWSDATPGKGIEAIAVEHPGELLFMDDHVCDAARLEGDERRHVANSRSSANRISAMNSTCCVCRCPSREHMELNAASEPLTSRAGRADRHRHQALHDHRFRAGKRPAFGIEDVRVEQVGRIARQLM